jgi:MSHA biogenesis protein MshM
MGDDMYLEHFKIRELPFTLTPNTGFFCNLSGHQAALNVLLLSLRSGEGFIKIVGEVGTGKTLLCRMLLEQLGDEFVTAYVPNPDLTPSGLRKVLAQELGVPKPHPFDQQLLLDTITERLMELHEKGKHVVLLIDEAQALPFESLEALRLLTNLETKKSKLLQIVLFGQPELNERLNQPELRQLKQRICFSYTLPALNRKELDAYLFHRLAMAGHTMGPLFSKKACDLLFKFSRGTPRLINILCHKALMAAYGRGESTVTPRAMRLAVSDTESVKKKSCSLFLAKPSLKNNWVLILSGILLLLALAIKILYPMTH